MEKLVRSTFLVLALLSIPPVQVVDAKIPSPCSACGCIAEELQERLDSEPVGYPLFCDLPSKRACLPFFPLFMHHCLEHVLLQHVPPPCAGPEPPGRSATPADD